MRTTFVIATALTALLPTLGTAQTTRWSDAATGNWSDEAPRVRLMIDGSRWVPYGGPVTVRFQVSDNAYVAVVRVAGDGRMTILYPYSRTMRAAVRGGVEYWVRHPRLNGFASFYAADAFSGYVFAIASYSPLDLSRFENRDYERFGGWSRFTQVNRQYSFRPDVYIDRFAAAVLWDLDTPFDYDVDYYHTAPRPGIMSAYAMCAPMLHGAYGTGFRSLLWDWDSDFLPYPYNAMCRDWYSGTLRCLSMFMLTYYNGCLVPPAPVTAGPWPGVPADSTPVSNKGVVIAGMAPPTPTPIPAGEGESPPLERPRGRFDQTGAPTDLDAFLSIPARATRKMKAEDTRRDAGGTSFTRTAPAGAKGDKPPRAGPVVAETAPPPREPVKTKATAEPRPTTATRSRGFETAGSGSRAGSQPDSRDRNTSKPGSAAQPAGQPASQGSLQGATTTEKKKPPL